MARGWESKGVEAQMEEAAAASAPARAPLSPEEAARRRHREGLELSRRRVLHELESSRDPRHRQLLEAALAALAAELARSQ